MTYYIYGKHSVTSCILNTKRITHKIIVSSQANFNYIKDLLSKNKDLTQLINKLSIENINHINKLVGESANHQGFVALISPIVQPTLNEILTQKTTRSTIVILDQANDSGNIGAILRSCAAFNADCLITPKDNSPSENSLIARTSSGALEVVPFIQVTNINSTISELKNNNYWVIGFSGAADDDFHTNLNFDKVALVFGSEHKGLRSLVEKSCDLLVKIPFNAQKIESLNLANAASISLFHRFIS
ncbi:23S rRNA (guanosine(2251)-2'-O)-methyltransferase RlmB [Rickettsiales bacterium LUAb2]